MTFLLMALSFVIGICFGSFANVVIDRVFKDESIFTKSSYCDHCKKKILWFDLIPVISFFLLARKCRFCGKKISWQYPLVEIITGFLFAAFDFWILDFKSFPTPSLTILALVFYLIVATALVIIFVSDLKYGLIYDWVIITASLVTLGYLTITVPSSIGPALLAAFVSSTIFLFLVVVTRGRGMGEGDIKLVFWLGLLTGWPNFIVMLLLSFIFGGLVAFFLLLAGRKKLGQTVPFAPILISGTIVTVIFGQPLLNLYLATLS